MASLSSWVIASQRKHLKTHNIFVDAQRIFWERYYKVGTREKFQRQILWRRCNWSFNESVNSELVSCKTTKYVDFSWKLKKFMSICILYKIKYFLPSCAGNISPLHSQEELLLCKGQDAHLLVRRKIWLQGLLILWCHLETNLSWYWSWSYLE